MARFKLSATVIAAVIAVFGIAAVLDPAAAQFGSIFGDPPPRPPASVPNRPGPPPIMQPEPATPPQQQPGQQGSTRQPSGIQSQPLPAPPGAIAIEPPPEQSPQGRAPGTRQPRGTAQPANTAPQPGDEVVLAPLSQKITNPTAIFSGLDKITGRIISFDVAIDETVQFGALQVTPRACYTRPPTETPNTDAFLEVDEVTLQGEIKRVFTGWMFAASPGLHAVEHPIYDVWLTDCKGGKSAVAETPPTAPAQAPQRPARQQAQPRQPTGPRPPPALPPPLFR